ncbi:hypothetical protein SAY86_028550 [Trapa natans]|uniref:Uncharacterized protein n=1 Tax=Trapa natans TaxID=22666 RepID=A0AAN7M0T6_TRANT|nr:hypothetical protein SAY86_028550 [Trapa natans]
MDTRPSPRSGKGQLVGMADRKNVEALSLGVCSMDDLLLYPEQVGRLENLRLFHQGDVSSIKTLSIEEGTEIKELPDIIYRLRKLKQLSLCECELLEGIPPSIGKLQSLIVLDLRGTQIEALPSSISTMGNLEVHGSYLREIPKLSEILLELYVESEKLEKNGDISRLNNLVYLTLVGGYQVSIPRELKSLISLFITGCVSLEKIEGLFELENLEDIQIDNREVNRDMEEIGTLQARIGRGKSSYGEAGVWDGEEEEDESDGANRRGEVAAVVE